jgi:hypothetical protein
MSGALQAVFQNQRSFGPPPGQEAYVTAGSYSWVAPAGVTKVSVVAVGTGGWTDISGSPQQKWGGGGGGGLGYKNNITVVPGNSYSVVVGAEVGYNTNGNPSSFNGSSAIGYGGCKSNPSNGVGGAGGGYVGDGGGNGGSGGNGGNTPANQGAWGGTGGYSGNGGNGAPAGGYNGCAGSGGGGGGGASPGGYGGNIGILGQGANGAGGQAGGCLYGQSGSGGRAGAAFSVSKGAVRIIWPGCARSFPSTRTANE